MIEVHLESLSEERSAADAVIDRFPFVIGRHLDCDHRLNHECVSRRHCCFLLQGEEVWIQDLESTNGTYLNGKRIEVPQVLRQGDLITLHSFSFQVSFALVTR
jgi:pSer/pThr/pTyr-binding forkhead associated (FHA) protein